MTPSQDPQPGLWKGRRDGGGSPAQGGKPASLTGTVERFTFRNEESGFAVVRVSPEGGGKLQTAVGPLAQLAEGQMVEIQGEEIMDPRYGRQIKAHTAEVKAPKTTDGIIAYLGSGLVKGIGPATAARIVGRFGTETLQVIRENPQQLRLVKGLSKAKADGLVNAVRDQEEVESVLVFLRQHGLGPGLARRIVQHYGVGATAQLQRDPYRLADDVIGIGFRTADQLAQELGIAPDAPERLRAGLLATLSRGAKDGHCHLPAEELLQRTQELLGTNEGDLPGVLEAVSGKGMVHRESLAGGIDAVYPQKLYQAECGIAKAVRRLLALQVPPLTANPDAMVDTWCQRNRLDLAPTQRTAVATALSSPISVITGGPGVGKTTIIKALAELAGDAGATLLMGAPTGRAAKRLEESTGRAATTVHRLLEFQGGTGRFLRDDERPLEADLLVLDEVSMLDATLAYQLLRAVAPTTKLVLVGDVDQLPAVGAGQVLDDLIASGVVPVTRLDRIYRQQQGSAIVDAAHAVLAGEVPGSGGEGSDFHVVAVRDSEHAGKVIRHLVAERIPKAFQLDPLRDVQVLCPMYRGSAGAEQLNVDLQAQLNPGGKGLERSGRELRRGDKVLQVQNDHDREVYNGDTGMVTAVDPGDRSVRVRFAGKELDYGFDDLDQLLPAYAISVHRSQGSEYPAVVMPLVTEHALMLRRNLLYTALTRGKRLVVLVAMPRALELAVRSSGDSHRNTGLAQRIRGD